MKYSLQELKDIKKDYSRPYTPELLAYERHANLDEIKDSVKDIFKYNARTDRKIDFLIYTIENLEYRLAKLKDSNLSRCSTELTIGRHCTFICTLVQDFFKKSKVAMKELYYNRYRVKGRDCFNIKVNHGGIESEEYHDDTNSILLFRRFLPEMLDYMPRWLNPDNNSWFDNDETRLAVLHEILNTIVDEEIDVAISKAFKDKSIESYSLTLKETLIRYSLIYRTRKDISIIKARLRIIRSKSRLSTRIAFAEKMILDLSKPTDVSIDTLLKQYVGEKGIGSIGEAIYIYSDVHHNPAIYTNKEDGLGCNDTSRCILFALYLPEILDYMPTYVTDTNNWFNTNEDRISVLNLVIKKIQSKMKLKKDETIH